MYFFSIQQITLLKYQLGHVIKLKINEFEVLYMVSAQVTQPFADMEYQLLHVKY